MSIRSRLVGHPKNKLISNSEQLFIATDLFPITFSRYLSPHLHGENSTNSQIDTETADENKHQKYVLSKYYQNIIR